MPRKRTATATLLVKTQKGRSLEKKVTDDSLAKCNLQPQSPLFGVLPPELRNNIFELATLRYDDDQHTYHSTDFFYRPGHHAKHKIDTALLLTCRRSWLEANHLPMSRYEPTFWFEWDERRPSWTHHKQEKSKYSLRRARQVVHTAETARYETFMNSLTANNISNLKSVHFLGQLLFLESQRLNNLLQPSVHGEMPKIPHVKVTVRHTDWYMWEVGEDLHLDRDWIQRLLSQSWFFDSVKTFELQLETVSGKVPQLEAIVQVIKNNHYEIGDRGGHRYWKLEPGSGIEVLTWEGPANIGGYMGDHPLLSQDEKLEYRVYSLVWKCCAA